MLDIQISSVLCVGHVFEHFKSSMNMYEILGN